jgi:hypothetical protein
MDMDQVEYSYFLSGTIRVPETWKKYIYEMLERFDKELRIKWLPKPLSTFIVKLRKKNKILGIKTSFGELKVSGDFSNKFKNIIKEIREKCRNTCEFCGGSPTEKVTIKGWIYNCCKNCKSNDSIKGHISSN